MGRGADSLTITLGPVHTITVRVGAMVLVRSQERDCYGAVVQRIEGMHVNLTFTPRGERRRVLAGEILSAFNDQPATLDLSSVPQYQPDPQVTPRRRRAKVDVQSM